MNGVHDMGGMHGFGPVQPEPNEPTFHSEWEGRCLALNRAMNFTRLWNIDQGRAAIENLPPIPGGDYVHPRLIRLGQDFQLRHLFDIAAADFGMA